MATTWAPYRAKNLRAVCETCGKYAIVAYYKPGGFQPRTAVCVDCNHADFIAKRASNAARHLQEDK